MNILEELWYGNINPQEQSKDNNRAIKELMNLMGRNRETLSSTLTEEQQEALFWLCLLFVLGTEIERYHYLNDGLHFEKIW